MDGPILSKHDCRGDATASVIVAVMLLLEGMA